MIAIALYMIFGNSPVVSPAVSPVVSPAVSPVVSPAVSPVVTPSVTGRYIDISKTTGYLEIAEIQAYDNNNILVNPVSSSSSTVYVDSNNVSYPPTNAYDNKTTTFFATGNGTVGSTGSLFIQLDYGNNIEFSKIVITSRVDCCKNMIVGAVVSILDVNKNVTFTSYPLPSTQSPTSTTTPEGALVDANSNYGFETYTITLPNQLPIGTVTPSGTGRYIDISKTTGYLEIAEIQAYDNNNILVNPVSSSNSTVYVNSNNVFLPSY